MLLENKIWGVVAPPRLSLNNNLYLPESMISADGKTVPFLFDHEDFEIGEDGRPTGQLRQVKPRGYVTLQWNHELQRLEYIGELTDPASVRSIQAGERPFVSLAAMPRSYDVYRGHIVPLGLDFFSVSAVAKPGIPETTLNMEKLAEGFYGSTVAKLALLEGDLRRGVPNSEDKAQDSTSDFSWRAQGRSARTTGGKAVRFWADKIPGKRSSVNVDDPAGDSPLGKLDKRSDIVPRETAAMSTSTAGVASGVDTWQGPMPIYTKKDRFFPQVDPTDGKKPIEDDSAFGGPGDKFYPMQQNPKTVDNIDQKSSAPVGNRGSGANVRSFYNEDLRLRVEFLLLQQKADRRNSLLERLNQIVN